MMNLCNKCAKVCGPIFLLSGIGFLLRDLNLWNFWNLQWWTILFVFGGIGSLASSKCPECQALRSPGMGKKK